MNKNILTKIEKMRLSKDIVNQFNVDEFNSFILQQSNINDKKQVIHDFINELFRITYAKLTSFVGDRVIDNNSLTYEIRDLQEEISQSLLLTFEKNIKDSNKQNKEIQDSYSLFFLEFEKVKFAKIISDYNKKNTSNNEKKVDIDKIKQSINESMFQNASKKTTEIINENSNYRSNGNIKNNNETPNNEKKPFYQYLLAFFAFNIVGGVTSSFISFFLVSNGMNTRIFYPVLTTFSFLMPIIVIVSMVSSFVLMCYLFDTNNMRKLIPYIWFIDGLLYFSKLGNEVSVVKNFHGAQLLLSMCGFILAMLIIHIYVRRETNY